MLFLDYWVIDRVRQIWNSFYFINIRLYQNIILQGISFIFHLLFIYLSFNVTVNLRVVNQPSKKKQKCLFYAWKWMLQYAQCAFPKLKRQNNNKTCKISCSLMMLNIHPACDVAHPFVYWETASSSSLRIPILTLRLVSCDRFLKSGKRPIRK